MAKKLYIIDGHAHIYAAYYAPMRQQLVSPAGEPTKATYIFTNTLLGLIKNQKPDMLVVAMDSKAPCFRSEIYPKYKAHRPPMPDDLPVQIGHIDKILAAMNIPTFRIDGFEADDLIGTLAKKASKAGIDVYICSKDKDMLQLLDEHVCTFDIKTAKRVDPDSMQMEMKISPSQFVDCLALQGDTADNVPGVPDVGPKTALDWIRKYDSLDNLYDHADEIKGKRGESLRKSREIAFLSKKLVTIDCDAPVDLDCDACAVKEFDKVKLSELFGELGFNRLAAQLGLAKTDETAEPIPDQNFGEPGSAKTVKHDYKLIDTSEKFESFLIDLKKQKLFAIDTETTSINAMRAELVGICFSWQRNKGFYLPVKAPLGLKHLDLNEVREKIEPIMADESVKKIGQNIKYDMLVMQNAQMPMKGIYFDTMVASYCLDAERSHSLDNMAADFLNYHCIPISALIGKGKNQLTFDLVDPETACEYAAEDADITFQLYLYLKNLLEKQPSLKKLFDEVEMPLVSCLTTMEHNGVSLNTALLKKMSGEISKALDVLTDKIYGHAGVVFNIDSPKQLAEILFDRLNLQTIGIGKKSRSTNAAILEQLADQHPIVELVLEYRQLSKLQNTYISKLGLMPRPIICRPFGAPCGDRCSFVSF